MKREKRLTLSQKIIPGGASMAERIISQTENIEFFFFTKEDEKTKQFFFRFKQKQKEFFCMWLLSLFGNSSVSLVFLYFLMTQIANKPENSAEITWRIFFLVFFLVSLALSHFYLFIIRNTSTPGKIKIIISIYWFFAIVSFSESTIRILFNLLSPDNTTQLRHFELFFLVLKYGVPSILANALAVIVWFLYFWINYFYGYYYWLRNNQEKIERLFLFIEERDKFNNKTQEKDEIVDDAGVALV